MTNLSRRNFFRLAAGAAALVAVPNTSLAPVIHCDSKTLCDDGPGLTALLKGEPVEFLDPSIAKNIGWVTPQHIKLFGNFNLKTPVYIGREFSGKRITGGHYDIFSSYGFIIGPGVFAQIEDAHFCLRP